VTTKYTQHYNRKTTPQTEPIPGTPQVKNSAGGYAFAVDDWARLERFLILGTEGGTYYASERKLTRESAAVVERCLMLDGERTVAVIAGVSVAGRAAKNEPALFALALAMKLGDERARSAARVVVSKVARTGTHLLHLADMINDLGGWGRGTRSAFADWFNDKPVERAAYQAVKYQSRDSWAMRDLLRLSHPTPRSIDHDRLYRWITKGELAPPQASDGPLALRDPLAIVEGFERAKEASSVEEVAYLVREFKLPREAVPTKHLKSPLVWEALLDEPIGMTALVRNLATMTRVGLLAPMSDATRRVCARISDAGEIRRGKMHPVSILSALRTYASGYSARGSSSWHPVQRVVDALDAAFYHAFDAVEPTGKRTLIALDVSGSMTQGEVAGVPGLTPREASAAMAMVTARVEPEHLIVAFTAPGGITPTRQDQIGGRWGGGTPGIHGLPISARGTLREALSVIERTPMGGTDCSLPMLWAIDQRAPIDTFVVYTDNETWAGAMHPVQALRRYREVTGIPARLVVVGMTATEFSIADPADRGMLDVVGFDSSAPALIADFARG